LRTMILSLIFSIIILSLLFPVQNKDICQSDGCILAIKTKMICHILDPYGEKIEDVYNYKILLAYEDRFLIFSTQD